MYVCMYVCIDLELDVFTISGVDENQNGAMPMDDDDDGGKTWYTLTAGFAPYVDLTLSAINATPRE